VEELSLLKLKKEGKLPTYMGRIRLPSYRKKAGKRSLGCP